MALAIDASSPITATNSVSTTATVASASFTPPANSLLVVLWAGDEQSGGSSATPTITGGSLTYTLRQWKANGQGTPALNGQAAIWTAPVASSAAMTVTVTQGTLGNFREAALRVLVITDTSQPTVGTSSKGGQSTGTAVPMAYTATQTGSWGFSVISDWDVKGAETAGTGTTLIGSANIGTAITYGFFRRTTADGTSAATTTINGTLPTASTNLAWAAVEIKAASAAANPAITFTSKRRRPALPRRRSIGQSPVLPPASAPVNPAWVPGVKRYLKRALVPVRRAKVAYPPLSVSTNAAISASDTGVGTEGTTLAVTLSAAETGSGVEATSIAATLSAAETGTGTDTAAVGVAISSADTGTGTEGASLTVTLSSSETGAGTEAVVAKAFSDAETGTGTEGTSIAATLSAAETGTGTDAGSVVVGSPAYIESNFESLANTTTITTGNTNFNVVNIAASTSATIDTSITSHFPGKNWLKFASTVTSNTNASWTSTGFPTAANTNYARGYFYLTANPSAEHTILAAQTSAGVSLATLRISSTGKLRLYTTVLQATSTASVNLNAPFRIEWSILIDGVSGSLVAQLYNSADSTTPTETISFSGNTGTTQIPGRWGVGLYTSQISTLWVSEIAFSSTTWIGPTAPSDNDSGTGTDALAALALGQGDTGTGTESTNVGIAVTASDTGTGVDARAALTASLTASDAGAGADARLTLAAALTGTELGTGTEGASVVKGGGATPITSDDTGVFRESAGTVKSGTFFTPPSALEHVRFHGRVTRSQNVGLTVLKTGASYTVVADPLYEQISAADIMYLGGRSYQVDGTEAAALTAAGYGAYLSLQVLTG